MYQFYLDDVLLPVTPSAVSLKVSNQNETFTLINEGEMNVLKQPGLSKISFEALFWMGYEVGQGGGAEAVTRAEFAALMVSMMDEESLKEFSTTAAPFGDVQPGSGSAPAIATANNADIMVGCGAGAFKPDRELTWGELITVLSRFSGDDTPPEVYTGGHWAKDAINIAISLDWLEYSEDFDPGEIVTCSEIITFVQGVFQWAEIQS